MINSISDTSSLTAPAPMAAPEAGDKDAFNAALKAAQKAKQREQEHASELAQIRDKGFTDWARDTRIEKLKEELRKKVMAEMGLDEDQLAKLAPAVQQVLEQKIQNEVEKRLQEQLAKEEDPTGQGTAQQPQVAASQPMQPGKNDRQGMNCPVIPALVWPGGASIF